MAPSREEEANRWALSGGELRRPFRPHLGRKLPLRGLATPSSEGGRSAPHPSIEVKQCGAHALRSLNLQPLPQSSIHKGNAGEGHCGHGRRLCEAQLWTITQATLLASSGIPIATRSPCQQTTSLPLARLYTQRARPVPLGP